ncbi:hypothetical protein HDV05_005838 [Chytridiales sp. JEL 0842]|nr:hypothetical protein HDV05_005838 [Chytridiales sp. JEL 0842]
MSQAAKMAARSAREEAMRVDPQEDFGVTMTGDSGTFVDRIINEHKEVQEAFEHFKQSKQTAERRNLGITIIRMISQHSVAEELEIYPLYEKILNDRDLADRNRAEHQEVKEMLAKVDMIKVEDDQFEPLLEKAIQAFVEHSKHEETYELPTLSEKFNHQEAVEIGRRFSQAKRSAPTHPHPMAPSTGGVAEKVAGAMAKPIDAARDFAERPSEREV